MGDVLPLVNLKPEHRSNPCDKECVMCICSVNDEPRQVGPAADTFHLFGRSLAAFATSHDNMLIATFFAEGDADLPLHMLTL